MFNQYFEFDVENPPIYLVLIAINIIDCQAASPLDRSQCNNACVENYQPVCADAVGGTEKRTFGNECVYASYACQNGLGESE